MKSVPKLISYLHEFSWNFSQFLAIYFERFLSGVILIWKTLTCQTPLSAPDPPGSAPLPRGCHAPRRACALNVLSRPRAGVPIAQRRSDRPRSDRAAAAV
jgi:hypothetical protein